LKHLPNQNDVNDASSDVGVQSSKSDAHSSGDLGYPQVGGQPNDAGGRMSEEGWYTDPYRLHEHRWFSDGSPTSLVRDKGKTSKDAPPDSPYIEDPKLVEPPASSEEDDLRRGGDTQGESVDPVDAAWSYFTRSSTGF
jgi:hypothetical protein